MLRESFQRILREYQSAMNEPFSGHPLAGFLRHELPDNLKSIVDNPQNYKFNGSPGKGIWATCPWVAIFDIFITETAQSGYYLVYLFREDMRGVYLSLNQGVTEIRMKYKDDPKEVLKIKASEFRSQIGETNISLEKNIDLAVPSSNALASFYEAGNIYARYYSFDNFPSERRLIVDLKEMLRLYKILSYNENIPKILTQMEEDELDTSNEIEDLRKLREHKRYDRNAKLSKKAKRIHGYTCQACGFNFEHSYGKLGENFIEAHHLVPISELKGQAIELDPRKDFVVLCANCHRMIHKFKNTSNMEQFKKIIH